MKKLICILLTIILSMAFFTGCAKQKASKKETIKFAAAASLEKMFEHKLIPMFLAKNPQVQAEGVYAGSGKLLIQLEQGLAVDVFIPASPKEMAALQAKGKIAAASPLLQNKLVLIVPKANSTKNMQSFTDFVKAKQPAIGDPKTVPAGRYAQEALQKLELWDKVKAKLSLGSNVVEVLSWVAQGSADAGFVYATDAASNDKVAIVASAPETLKLAPIIYPVGTLKTSQNKELAHKFVAFLNSAEARKVYAEYGFSIPAAPTSK